MGKLKTLPTDVPAPSDPAPQEPTRVPVPAPAETPRRGPGRPPGAKNRPKGGTVEVAPALDDEAQHATWAQQGAVIAEEFVPLVGMLSEYLAVRLGELWRFSEDENRKLSCAVGTLVAKYRPAWAGRYREELSVASAVVGIIGARVVAQLMAPKEVAAEDAGKEGS